ncbi:MAG: hypothetical protein ACREIA_03575 [Opitutaceae bacterium]
MSANLGHFLQQAFSTILFNSRRSVCKAGASSGCVLAVLGF